MADPVQIHTFKELVDVMTAQRRGVEFDEAEQALTVATGEVDLSGGKVLVRWDASDPFLHVIQPMVDGVPADRADAVSRFICRVNNAAKLVGLGYDEGSGVIYYRVTLIRMKDGIRSDYAVNVSRAATQSAKELLGAVRAIAGGSSVDEAAKLAGI